MADLAQKVKQESQLNDDEDTTTTIANDVEMNGE